MYDSLPASPDSFPRLFFTEADLPAIRRKLELPECQPYWQRLLNACEDMLEADPAALHVRHVRAWHLAFAYRVTDREDFGRKAVEMAQESADRPHFHRDNHKTNPGGVSLSTGAHTTNIALAYDWANDLLSDDQRQHWREAIKEKAFDANLHHIQVMKHPSAEWYTCNGIMVINGPILMAAILLENEMDTREIYDVALTQVRRAVDAHCADGGYTEGPSYWNYNLRHMLLAVETLHRLKRIDLYNEPFLRRTGDYLLHYIHPHFSECANPADSGFITKFWSPMPLLASRHRREDWQWIVKRMLAQDWQNDGEALEYSLFFLLHYDPDLPESKPDDAQRNWLFSGLQHQSLRSDWSDEAIHMLWLNGPSNTHHNHLHLNSFSISAFGRRLLIDMGIYDYANYNDYRRMTEGHNSLLVDGKGQVITTDESIWCRRVRPGMWGTVYGEFRCLRDEADAVISTGSVINAYPEQLRTFDRTIAFIDRRFFLLHDFIELLQQPPALLTWHFHSAEEIEFDGVTARLKHDHAQMDITFLSEYALTGQIKHDHAERDGTRQYNPYLALDAQCDRPTFDLFALLTPYREGQGTRPTVKFENGQVTVTDGDRQWQYDPRMRSLTEPVQP